MCMWTVLDALRGKWARDEEYAGEYVTNVRFVFSILCSACREVGVEKLIHVSALNASANPEPLVISGGSKYLASKYRGELAVREEFPDATIIRPADIYGQEDRFLRYYASVWRRQFRSMPLWHKGERTIKQPVAVSDVAQAIVNAAKDADAAGKVYQAVGPRRYLLSELVDWFHREMRKDEKHWKYQRYDLRWDPTFLIKARLAEAVSPSWPMGNLHLERIEREYVTDCVESDVPTLEDLGVNLTYMEDQVWFIVDCGCHFILLTVDELYLRLHRCRGS